MLFPTGDMITSTFKDGVRFLGADEVLSFLSTKYIDDLSPVKVPDMVRTRGQDELTIVQVFTWVKSGRGEDQHGQRTTIEGP